MHSLLKNVPHHVAGSARDFSITLTLARQEDCRVRAAMPPPPAAALPPPHHRTVRRTTVVAAPVRLPSPVRPRRTSWRLPMPRRYCQEREGTATWNSPLRRSHVIVTTVVAAVRRRPPVRRPSVLLSTSWRCHSATRDPVEKLGVASAPVTRRRIVTPAHTPVTRRTRRRTVVVIYYTVKKRVHFTLASSKRV